MGEGHCRPGAHRPLIFRPRWDILKVPTPKGDEMKPKPLVITTYSLPAPVRPRRIALAADLHNGDPAPLFAALQDASPDMICLSGDLYEGPPRCPAFAFDHATECLRFCAAMAPTFYAPGNHDKTEAPGLRNLLSACGVTYLRDSFVSFEDLLIGGLSSAYYQDDPTPDMAFARRYAAEAGYKILLCHHPEYYRRYLRPAGLADAFDLILSGHNHGGQWAIGSHGLYVPGQGLFPPHCAGLFDGRLVVSRGVCNNVPVPRIGTPPELVLIDLFHKQ